MNHIYLVSLCFQIYQQNLQSKVIGNTVLYQSITKTTQSLIEPFLFKAPLDCGLVAMASRQIAGVGETNTRINGYHFYYGLTSLGCFRPGKVKNHFFTDLLDFLTLPGP